MLRAANRRLRTLKQGNEDLIATQDIPLQGLHNAANVMAAVALCEAIGLPREALLEHVKTFQGLPHRVEKIGEKNGVVFIDDSKGTNVGATAAAIAGLQNPRTSLLPVALRTRRCDEHLRHHPPNRYLKQPPRRARALAVERADAQMGGDRVGE